MSGIKITELTEITDASNDIYLVADDSNETYKIKKGNLLRGIEVSGIAQKYFNNIFELKSYEDFTEGDFVATYGYYNIGDGGHAKYKIVTLDDYINSHASDIISVISGADEYGSFELSNGLIAMLVTEGITTPEQWGAKGDGVTNDKLPFMHMFGKTKTGVINFRPGAEYLMGHVDNSNPYQVPMVGKPWGGYTARNPILANINRLTINGNGSKFTVEEGNYTQYVGYDIDFSCFMLGGVIDHLTIRDIHFDGNGFTQSYNGYNFKNHNICYIASSLGGSKFANVTIENCIFEEGGFSDVTGNDFGGDGILILYPGVCENVTIRNNKFINVGRWAIAFDLNHDLNRHVPNVTIDNNIMIIEEDSASRISRGIERNLGFIDFEIYHSWDNLRITNNYVKGGSVGIAMGGGAEACSKNI